MSLKAQILVLAASAAMIVPAMAADIAPLEPVVFEEMHEGKKPAVSGLNGKLEIGYSYFQYDLFDGAPETEVNANNIYGIGSVSLPVGARFGVQIDAGIMQGFEDQGVAGGFFEVEHDAYGVAGHFFWRDPDLALVGLYADYQRINRDTELFGVISFPRQTDVFRLAAAGEYYLNNFSVEGHVGADFLSTTLNIGPFEITDTGTFLNARGVAAYYPTDNARIFAGAKYAFEEFAGLAGAEMMFASDNPVAPAVFIEGSLGENSTTINAGLRLYFGPEGKSLKRRHREDDPASQLFKDMPSLNACSTTVPGEIVEYAAYQFMNGHEGNGQSVETNGPSDDTPMDIPTSSCGLGLSESDLRDIGDIWFD